MGLLGVVFVTLKLCGVIGWSWWWVTLPFWGGLALWLGILAIMGLLIAAAAVGEAVSSELAMRKREKEKRARELSDPLK